MVIKKSFVFFFFIGLTINAQKVSNISFRQEQSNIIVSYDLETKLPCKVRLYVSKDGGNNWQGPLMKVEGDIGDKISSGRNNVVWKVLEEFEELRGSNIVFQVKVDGRDFNTTLIGSQEWTVRNLDVVTYRNGDIIPEVKDPDEWGKLKTGAWCYLNNDSTNGVIYGKLYNWYAVNDPRGLAPEGFHIPTIDQWKILVDFLGGNNKAGKALKSTKGWENRGNGSNSSNFNGLPGGCRIGDTFQNLTLNNGIQSSWWSSTMNTYQFNQYKAWSCTLYFSSNYVGISDSSNTKNGYWVRCIKD